MRKSRFNEEQILKVLHEGEAGRKIKELCQDHGISEHTYYRCPNNEPGPNHPRVRWQSDDNDHPGGRHEGRLRQYAPETDSAEPRRRRVAR